MVRKDVLLFFLNEAKKFLWKVVLSIFGFPHKKIQKYKKYIS
jgi:hypothetical protein